MMVRILKFVVSIGIVVALVWWADAAAIFARLREASVGWLLVALVALTTLTFLMAKRWQIVAQTLQLDIAYRRALREYYIAQLVNLVLPGGVVGDIARAVRIRDAGDMVRAAQSVAAERAIGQSTMFVALAIGLSIALLIPGGIAWPPFVWIGIAVLGGLVIAAMVVARSDTATGRFLALVLSLIANGRLMAYAIVIVGLLILSIYACARATGTVLPMSSWFTLIPLVLSSMLIPLSVGGWGWREGAAAALFPMIGATPSAGIAMGIAYGAMMLIAALPALYFLMQGPALVSTRTFTTLDT